MGRVDQMLRDDGNDATGAGLLAREMQWLDAVIMFRLNPDRVDGFPVPPSILDGGGSYAALLRRLRLDAAERLVLILALAPYLAPEQLDPFLLRNEATGRPFSEFGGLSGQVHAGFLPTAQTALYLLAGHDLDARLRHQRLFTADGRLVADGLIDLDRREALEPPLAAILRPGIAWQERLLGGNEAEPAAGPGFPATRITTPLGWEDLVLDDRTRRQVETVRAWIRHAGTLMRDPDLSRRLKPGYRCLFHGPPGTGKTLTACLLGKAHDLPVYRVDLSRVVSKWVGETEKNLAALFDQAQHRDWILFFDEAEALFGKRTESQSANDRSANQQISYLLQRLEDFPGLTILATNNRAHMDEAFSRRFQSVVHFPMPDADARLRLWRETFRTGAVGLADDVDFARLAARHDLTGGAIANILRHACLTALDRALPVIQAADLAQGIREEMQKEGRFLS
ncbi:ATP-binding protein [Niveispirillum sp. KHB5.9]|uniref:ATP-binding protein n=1 Tax=Niveispirillum sp. KHB5.9 TaxID=3400269 RepID=UPI003A8C3EA3